jgi:streptomycin 6-kinase
MARHSAAQFWWGETETIEGMRLEVPASLAESCRKTPERAAWLKHLPAMVVSLERRWSINTGSPFESRAGWVAPVVLADGKAAVLKIGMPHMEGLQELQGMVFWNGDPTARVLEADDELFAMLLERCEPGTTLKDVAEADQDVVIAGLLRRLWRVPSPPHAFRPLSAMTQYWREETLLDIARWKDAGLVREGLRLLEELPQTAKTEVLLATDLHAGNVLRATREPWLVIDPKPFLGDPAYDVTQHLLNCRGRMLANPNATIHRLAQLLCLDHERVRLWMFARTAAEPREDWNNESLNAIARSIAP